jgi:1-deoxy-D-xylulose-5-phosphate reductoisomerase
MSNVTPDQALGSPDLEHGPSDTTNSATLVNKGLELLEAHLLYGVDLDRIDVVVHPQSIVALHGAVRRRLDACAVLRHQT